MNSNRAWWCLALVFVVSCSPKQQNVPAPCDGVDCGSGRCAVLSEGVPACLCNPGFVARGLACEAVPPADLCASNPCASLRNSLCKVTAGVVDCVCPDSTIEVNSACVTRTECVPNPCQQPHRTHCEVVGGAASCVCDPGFVPMGNGCSVTPVWTCAGQHVDGDSAEADECPTLAKSIGISTDESRTLSPLGDDDWIILATTPGRLFNVTVSADVPTLVEIYERTGITLIAADNRGTITGTVSFVAPDVEVLARVRALRGDDTGTYTVRYEETGIDDYANDVASARTLVAGASFTGNLQYARDLDVVKLEVPSNTAVRMTLAAAGSQEVVFDVQRGDAGVYELRLNDSATVAFPAFTTVVLTARANNERDEASFIIDTQSLGPDDYSDEPAFGARLNPNGAALSGVIQQRDGGDVDSFFVPQVDQHVYRATWMNSNLSGTVVTGAGTRIIGSSFSSATTWEADSAANASLLITTAWSFGTNNYSVRVEDLGVDDHGDTLADATAMNLGVPIGGRLETSTDVDVFTFDAMAGHIISVTLSGTTYGAVATLFGPSGSQLGSNGQNFGAIAPLTGRYSVQVARQSTFADDVLAYTLSVTDQGVDDHGDTSATATAVMLGTATSGSLQYSSDVDVFSFTALANHVYAVTSGSTSVSMTVNDPTSTVVASGSSTNSLNFVSTVAGRYTVALSNNFNTAGGYTLTITDLGVEDHGSTNATATPIVVGTPVNGTISSASDLDVFSLTPTIGNVYVASLAPGYQRIEVRNSANVTLASGFSGSVSFVASATPLYLVVSNYSPGSYTLSVQDRGPDDHGNVVSSATPITLGTNTNGTLQYDGDIDVFSVTVVSGHHHTVTCTTSMGTCSFNVTNGSGVTLASAYSSSVASTAFKAGPGLTTAYIAVSSYGSPVAFVLRVTDAGADDHGDDRNSATAVSIGAAATAGTLETVADVDAFTIATSPGEVVRLDFGGVVANITDPFGSSVGQVDAPGPTSTGFYSTGGSWLVTLRARSNATGATPYTLTATRGTDDVPINTASPLTLGMSKAGTIDYLNDTDSFTVSLTSGTTINASLTQGSRGEIRGPTGYIGSIYSFTTNPVTISTSGVYTFTVQADYSSYGLISYSLFVQ
ncbi:MAG: hypothetical protein QM817_03415 [Archangium sp.]